MKTKRHLRHLLPLLFAGLWIGCAKEKVIPSENNMTTEVNAKYFLSEKTARSIASRFNFYEGIASSRNINPQIQNIQTVEAINDSHGVPAYYVINYSNNTGFLILSADYRQMPVLGYSHEGSFDKKNMPLGLEDFVNEEVQEINNLRAH